ncbi:MAG TPA: alpha/beta hydrolase fold domain-containing protein, partial [Micromonosporaceae bacterium]|nr:alpha/beta hydrolase fold domain-containing protein [Micromonosporaceae bacterium]
MTAQLIGIVIVSFVLLASSVRLVRADERGVVLRFGRLLPTVRSPGVRLIVPVADVMRKVSMRTVVTAIPPQLCTTRDRVPLTAGAVVSCHVADPAKVVLTVHQHASPVALITEISLRAVIARVDLDVLLSDQDRINTELAKTINAPFALAWGLHIDRAEINGIALSEGRKRALKRRARAHDVPAAAIPAMATPQRHSSPYRIPAPRSAPGEPSGTRPAAPPRATHATTRHGGLVVLEPAAQAFADANNVRPYVFELGPDLGRSTLSRRQSGPATKPKADVTDLRAPGGPHGEVPVRIVRPPGAGGRLPVVLFVHGAGWVFGDTVTHDRLVRELATGVGAAVVFPDYRRSPEARYPSAVEECYAVAEWVRHQGSEHGLDGSRVALAGDSAGGNIAAALTLLAKQRSGPAFAAQVLFYPVTNAFFDTGSYRQFAEGYHLRRDAMIWCWNQYSTAAQRAEITASPLRATVEQLAGLPPALVITAEADILRDEGEAYANKLRAADVPVTTRRYRGTIHDFVMLDAMA